MKANGLTTRNLAVPVNVLREIIQKYTREAGVRNLERELSSVFGIQSIPSLLFIPKEGQPQMAMGALPKETFKQAISEVLSVSE